MLKFKEKPEDFIVKEVIDKSVISDKGKYSYYLLKKRDMNTLDALEIIARMFKIRQKFINFAGTKDKNAVTEQYISISNGPKRDLKKERFELSYLGRAKERIELGGLLGNEFEIIVHSDRQPRQMSKIVNYYDNQRFGNEKQNHIIGKLLVKREFAKVCDLLGIEAVNNDYVGGIRTINKSLLRLYVHAYQSFLWNEAVDCYVRKVCKKVAYLDYSLGKLAVPLNFADIGQRKIPFIGFGLDENSCESVVLAILDRLVAEEGITARDFIFRELPELSAEGGERDLLCDVDVCVTKLGSEKYRLKFFLNKGSYATIAIKSLFL